MAKMNSQSVCMSEAVGQSAGSREGKLVGQNAWVSVCSTASGLWRVAEVGVGLWLRN